MPWDLRGCSIKRISKWSIQMFVWFYIWFGQLYNSPKKDLQSGREKMWHTLQEICFCLFSQVIKLHYSYIQFILSELIWLMGSYERKSRTRTKKWNKQPSWAAVCSLVHHDEFKLWLAALFQLWIWPQRIDQIQ